MRAAATSRSTSSTVEGVSVPKRNVFSVAAVLLLLIEFIVPFGVAALWPEWTKRLGPGGPYLLAYWVAAVSLAGASLAAIGLNLSFRGRRGATTSAATLLLHVLIGAFPVITVIRLIFRLY